MRTYTRDNRSKWYVRAYTLVFSFIVLCTVSVLWAEETGAKHPLPEQEMKAFMCFTLLMLAPIVFTVAGIGLHLYLKAMFPRWTANIAFALRENPWKSFFLGLANIPFLLLVTCFFAGAMPPLVFIPLFLLFSCTLLGLIGKSENLGGRISSAVGVRNNPIASIFAAWPVIAILLIIPFVGWAILGYMLISGTGGVILSLFRFRRDIPTTESVLADDK